MSRLSLNPFSSENYNYRTKLSPEVCFARLKQRLVEKTDSSKLEQVLRADFPVHGRISGHHFVVYKSKGLQSSFDVSGELLDGDGFTKVVISVSAGLFTKILQVIFAILWVFITAGMMNPSPGSLLTKFLIWAAITAFLLGFPILGLWLARGETEFLLQFLRETFDVEEAEQPFSRQY